MRSSSRGSRLTGRFTPMFICGALVALLGVSVAPVQSACSLGCGNVEGSTGGDLFKAGQTYTYNLETEMMVQLTGNDPQDTSVRVQAQVLVTAGANCQHSMQVRKFGMWTKVGDQKVAAQKLAKDLEADIERPVRFAMKGQKIAKDICADPKDSVFALNIKRGLISLLQGHPTEQRGESLEYDVFGKCKITNSEVSGDATKIFLKRKDLTKCEGREHFTATGLVRSVFNSNSDVKSTPIMSGDYILEQRIKSGQTYPEAIQLTEYYEVGTAKALLSIKMDAAMTNSVKSKVVSKLVFLSMASGSLAEVSGGGEQKEIRFESLPNGRVASLNTLKSTMKNMIEKGFSPIGNVQEFTAEQFLQLVRLMRETKKDDLLTLFQQTKNGNVHTNVNLAKKLYFDALFRANSADSIEAISTLVGRQMDATEQKMAYMSLQFAGQLNKESLASIQKLMDANPSYEAYLVAGTLINKYCEQFACSPDNLKTIMDKFSLGLKCNGKMDKKQEHQMLAILKGLKNSGQVSTDAVLDKIHNCYQESIKIKRVRVQSVKTISAAVCHTAKGRDILKTILKEKTVDPEFRIHAYLGLIKNCPNTEMIEYLQGIYNNEETNQLMVFLKTHITSLKMTTDPSRQELRALVKDFDLSKHSLIGADLRKTSFNNERSWNLEALGVGGSMDSSVIYTKNGFLPRSMNLNFSAEVFGRDYNFLELEVRQENLEAIGEKFFGPRGYFATKKNQDIVNEIEQSVDQLKTETSFNTDRFNYRRRKRDAINLNSESSKFNKGLHNNDQDLNTDLDLDLSVNMFGSEVKFLALSELECFQEARNGDYIKGMTKAFNDALDKAKNWEKTVEAYHLLMDTEFEYPTGIGIPLKARAQISMATKFGAKLNFDLRDFMFSKNPSNDLKFQIEITPSMSLASQSGLFMDMGFQRVGMQLNGNLFTSLNGALDFKVQENGHKWNMDFRAKDKKQEFVKFDHKVIFVQQDDGSLPTETPLKFQARKRDYNGCFEQLNANLGMTFCLESSMSVPSGKGETALTALTGLISAPLNGPNRFGLWVDMDPEYNFQLLFQSAPQMHSVEFSMDCPHPTYKRMVKLRAEAGLTPKVYLKAALISPIKTMSAEVGYKNDAKEVVVYGEAFDDAQKYEAKIGFLKTGSNQYTPILLVEYPNYSQKSIFGYTIDGKIFVDDKPPKTTYTFQNLEIRKTVDGKKVAGDEPFIINGKVEYEPIAFVVDLRTEHGGNRIGVKGDLKLNIPHNLLIDFKTDSNNQDLNGEFFYDVKYEKNALFSQLLKAKIGSKKDYDMYVSQVLNLDKAVLEAKKAEDFFGAITKFEIKSSFTPSHPMTFDVIYSNEKNAKYENGIAFKCDHIDFNSQFNLKKTEKMDYDMGYKLAVNKFFINVVSKLNSDGSTVDLNKRKFVNKISLSNGFAFDLDGNFNHKLKTGEFDLDFENRLMDNTKKPQYKIGFNLKNMPKQLTWNLNVNVLNQPKDMLTGKFTLDKNEQFALEMILSEILNLNTEFKFNEIKVGKEKLPQVKGDGFVLLKFPKVNNYQVKANTKFSIGQPNYDVNVELFYDFERDNSKKAVFNTNNVVKKDEYHTKNSLEILASKYQVNGNFQRTGPIDNGLLKFDGQIILPSTRTFSADFKRKLDKKEVKDTDASYNGNVEFTLKDQTPEKGLRTIAVTGKLAELNPGAGKFDIGYKIELSDYDRSNLIFEPSVKIQRGDQMNLGLNIYGKMLPEKFASTLSIKNELKKSDQVNFDLKANYGKSVDASSAGHVKLVPGSTNFDYKIFSKLNVDKNSLAKSVPQATKLTAFKSIDLNLQGKSTGKLNQNFEWHFINEATVNGNAKYHANLDLVGNVDSFFNTKLSLLADAIEKTPFVLETNYMINKDVKLKKADDVTEDSAFHKTAVYQFFKNGGEFLGKVSYHGNEEVKLDVLLDKQKSDMHSLTGQLTSTVPSLKDHKVVVQVRRFDATSFTNIRMGLSADYYNQGAPWYKTNLVVDTTPDAPVFEAELDNLNLKMKSSVKFASKISREQNTFHSELVMVNFPVAKFDFQGKLDWSNYQLVTSSPLKMTIQANSPNWDLQNFEMTIKGNRMGQKATIDVNAVNKGKNLVNGQLDVAEGTANTGDKSIMLEGSGNLKWQDGAKRQLTFTLLRKKIGQSDRHMEFLLNGQLDKKNFLFEVKILEGTTIARHSICMNGDQSCTNIELKSDRKSVTFDNFEHEFIINFDVRPLGEVFESYYNNFGLTFNTKKVGFEFSNDFNLFIENKQRKYQVSAHSKNPGTTIEVTYPGRKMAVEFVHRLPTVKQWDFDFGSTMWLNKLKDPNTKMELRTFGNVVANVEKTEFTTKFSSYVQHPMLKKISVDGENVINFSLQSGKFLDTKVVFDIFQNAADKFTIQVLSNKEFKPNDLVRWDFNVKIADGAKVTNLLSEEYYVSLKQGEMVMKLVVDYPEPKFVNFDMSISRPKRLAKLEIGVAGDKLIDGGSSFNDKEKSLSLFFNVYHFGSKGHACVKATGNFVTYTQAQVHIECDHLATLDFDYNLDTAIAVRLADEKKTELYTLRLALDQEKFLDAQYNINKPGLTAFADKLQKNIETSSAQFQGEVAKKVASSKQNLAQRAEQFQKKLPNLTPLNDYVIAEGNKLYDEIQSDPTLKHICDAVEKLSNFLWKIINEYMRIISQYFTKIVKIVQENSQAIYKTFQENILPILSDFVASLRKIGQGMLETATAFLTRLFEEFNAFFGKYQEEFNKIAKQIGSQLRELHAMIVKFTTQLRTELENIINTALNFLKETFDFKKWLNRIGDLLREYKVEAYVKEAANHMTSMIDRNAILPLETKKFLDALIKYISNHLTNPAIPNTEVEVAELKKLSGLFVDAVTSIYKYLEALFAQQKSELDKNKIFLQFKDPATSMSKWQELLRQNFVSIPMMAPLSGSFDGEVPALLKFKWSGLNYLTSPETYKALIGGDWSRLFEVARLSNWIPPYKYQAQVIDGAHFMTFDGLHYTFAVKSEGGADSADAEPEGCYFVLAADSVHANFTVLGTFNNKQSKKLNSILVTDNTNNVFELKSNDKTYYNNKARDLPLHAGVNAWRNSLGQVQILHPAGVHITCERNLEVCSITVNGFYKNKLRGLLGNANDERFDDLQLQNGAFVDQHGASYDSFFQNYQLSNFNKVCPKLVTSTATNLHAHHGHGSPECDEVFKTFSYFQVFLPWFSNYKEACEHATMITEGPKLDTACTIARGFVRKLNAEYGIPAHVPEACYKDCSAEANLKELKVNSKKLDLIFLVDFNNTMYVELLPQLINEFKSTLKGREVTDLNLNVVGFNQNWKYPVYIANPDLMPKLNYANFIAENLKTMPLYSDDHFVTKYPLVNQFVEGFWRGYARAQVDLGLSSDAQAFQYAQHYPFRADAFKMIFIFRSDPLRYTANPVRTTLASALNVYTAARGIHMHLMAPVDDFTMTGSTQNVRLTKQVIGFNEKVVIQNADAKKRNNVGATNLRSSMQFTADMGTDIVLRNHDGNDFVFLAQNYQSRNAKEKKVFVSTMVNAVGEQLPRWSVTQRCHCGVFDGLYERDMCLVKESQLLAQSPKAPQRRG